MQQLATHRNLSEKEKKNVFLAIAAGCLKAAHDTIPGPEHQRRKRELRALKDRLLRHVYPRIPPVAPHNMELFKDTIRASEKVLHQILEETGQQAVHVLLNLAGFCIEELPLQKEHHQQYNALFDLWLDARQYKDVRSGERIFARIDSELQILVAQRGGIML